MPVFGREGFNFNQLMMGAGLITTPEPQADVDVEIFNVRGYWAARMSEMTPLFIYLYDDDAQEYLDFLPSSTTTSELKEVADEMGLSLVSFEEGTTPRDMTQAQIDAFVQTLFTFIGEDLRDISRIVTFLEDGENPQVFERRRGQWVHATSEFTGPELYELTEEVLESPIRMYDDGQQPRFVPGSPTRLPATPAA